uniref:RNA polymerase subunit H/Rpb5 C-terminal domain-containing protein n=1 Tax=viral metagenome TaxID=1070528 RepID=A0A6C0EZR2_9ZZZZ
MASNASKTISRLYTARKTLLELLSTRGYDVEGYTNFGVNEVNAMYTHKQLDMLVEIKGEQKSKGSKSKGEKGSKDKDVVETENKKTYVKFHLEKTLSVSHINDLIEDLYVLGVGGEIGGTGLSANANDTVLTEKDTLIIITKQEIKTMNQVLNQLSLQGRFIVLLSLDRLQFNILNHQYVPNHTILSDHEVVEMMKKYNVMEKSQLPDISRYDPVALAIGMRPGEVCSIDRPSKSAISSLYYRVCTQ